MIFFDFIFYVYLSKPHNEGVYWAGIITGLFIYLVISVLLQFFFFLFLNGEKIEFNYVIPSMLLFGYICSIIERKRYTIDRINKLDEKWSDLNSVLKKTLRIVFIFVMLFISMYNFGVLPSLIIKGY